MKDDENELEVKWKLTFPFSILPCAHYSTVVLV